MQCNGICTVLICLCLLLPTEPPADALVACNHEAASRSDLAAARHRACKQGAPAFSLDDMQRERKRARAVSQRLGRAPWRRGEHLSAGLEHVERLGQERRKRSGQSSRNE